MGIRMSTANEESSLRAFSQDILKIEINGPDVSSITLLSFFLRWFANGSKIARAFYCY